MFTPIVLPRPARRPLRTALRRAALVAALGGCLASVAHAQSVTGSIFGQAPAGAGTTILIRSLETGVTRTLSVDAQGRYRASDLPNGRYRVILQQDGAEVATRDDVVVNIASGTEVSFAGGGDTVSLDRIEVRGISAPPIDISQVDTRTVLTYEQLQALPIPRNATAAALLAPGAVASTNYDGVPSFGGSAASENAYYINGYPVTNPLTAIGFYDLPYEAIGQQQTLTGGYGAEFGRSTGGVVNIVTRRGSNEWKAGAYTVYTPKSLRASPRNQYYPDTGHFTANDPNPARRTDGTLYAYRNQNLSWQDTTGVYAGGPILRDRLFFFANADFIRTEGNSVRFIRTASAVNQNVGWSDSRTDNPRWLAKLDWYITDDHLVELTGLWDTSKFSADYYPFDYATFTHGSNKTGEANSTRDQSKLYVARYTGRLTDTLSVSALYGHHKITHEQNVYLYDPNCPFINAPADARAPGLTYNSCQNSNAAIDLDGRFDETKGGRLDLTWQLGRHELRFGYDRMDAESLAGTSRPGGYDWRYARADNPNIAVDPSRGVTGSTAAAGGLGVDGYYVERYYFTNRGQPKTEQASQYIEDRWQVNDRWLLSLGLRNEQFSNFTGTGEQYVSQRHQLAPRLGAVWDVKGDSTLKLFANAGRYHLVLPDNVAVRAASGSLFTSEYFTYTGVDPVTGVPTGLSPIAVNPNSPNLCPGLGSGGAVSSNLECGQAPDPRTVAAIDMKSHYQDEYIIGMERALGSNTSWGAKFTYRDLKSAIDDTCTPALGGRCFLFNPGEANSFWEQQADGSFVKKDYTAEQLGFDKLKRRYYALDLYWEQRTDTWYGKLEYTLSRNYGNTEGQLNSDLATTGNGQADVSVTQDWDMPQLMVGSNGLLPNHRAHVIKAFGYLNLNEEWRVGANALLASGRPRNCTSMYPTPDPGLYNGSYYWFCGLPGSNNGTNPNVPNYVPPSADYGPSPRGSHGTTPWTYTFNVNLSYTPKWAEGLTLQADVMNLFNRQSAGYYYPRYAAAPYRGAASYNQLYGLPSGFTTPRYFRFTVRYDF